MAASLPLPPSAPEDDRDSNSGPATTPSMTTTSRVGGRTVTNTSSDKTEKTLLGVTKTKNRSSNADISGVRDEKSASSHYINMTNSTNGHAHRREEDKPAANARRRNSVGPTESMKSLATNGSTDIRKKSLANMKKEQQKDVYTSSNTASPAAVQRRQKKAQQ
jgi:hypothetical protein